MTKVSVLIPAYNCTSTLAATVDSVLAQTRPADEVLIMDDGSTDATRALAQSYEPRVKVYWQPNGGLARTRNALISRATGELITFLDSDDIWHPRYIETQLRRFEEHPGAVAFFTGHINFPDGQCHQWPEGLVASSEGCEVLPPVHFFQRYNKETGPFGCFSYCAVPMSVLRRLGEEPFREQGAEDSYCCSLLSLLGPVVYCSTPLVAYRIRANSLSADHVWTFGVWVHTFELLQDRFSQTAATQLRREFGKAFAAKRRCYAKLLMGAGNQPEARAQLRLAIFNSLHPISLAKTIGMLIVTFLPHPLQPNWPTSFRSSPKFHTTTSALEETLTSK